MAYTKNMILEHLIHSLVNFDRNYNIAPESSYTEKFEKSYLDESDMTCTTNM